MAAFKEGERGCTSMQDLKRNEKGILEQEGLNWAEDRIQRKINNSKTLS